LSIKKIRMILGRIFATFVASALGVVGAGTIAGVELWKAVMMAGISGVAVVVEGLSRAYLADGELSEDEINSVFSEVNDDPTT
jgi:hypothetical protein